MPIMGEGKNLGWARAKVGFIRFVQGLVWYGVHEFLESTFQREETDKEMEEGMKLEPERAK